MRILFHAPPLLGHTLPMLPLAQALQRAGHAVLWAAGVDTQPHIRRLGFELRPAGPSRAWAMAELARQWPERAQLTPAQQVAEIGPRLFAGCYAPATLADLLALLDAWRPGLLVHDVMAHAAPLAAALRGVPSVSHGFGLPRPASSIDGAQARMAPQWRAQGLEIPADSGNHRDGHVDICPPSLRPDEPLPDGRRWLLAPASGTRRTAGTAAAARSGVVACFGTVHHQQASFDRLMEALRRGPWPARVALGRPLEPGLQEPAHVQVAPWLDLAAEWPRCRVGACHGGAGTVLGALAEGVPLLLLPVAADQFRNARALTQAGAALALLGEAQSTEAIGQALQRLHDETHFTQAAQALADEIAAMPHADEVAADMAAGWLTDP